MINRGRVALITTVGAAVLALAPWSVSAGPAAPTCDTSWANPVSGFWDVAANWTNGVPNYLDPTKDQVCIEVEGTYAVTVRTAVYALELTLGSGGGGVQTLKIEGNPSGGFAALTLINQGGQSAEGVRSDGVIALESSHESYGSAVNIERGSLVNDGVIRTDADGHFYRFLHGDLINNGALSVSRNLYESEPDGDWSNTGTITVNGGASLRLSNPDDRSSFTQTSGSIVNNGLFHFRHGQFTFSGGTATGNPLEVSSVDLEGGLSPSGGAATIKLLEGFNSELESDIGSEITLVLEGDATWGNSKLRLNTSRINAGTIKLASTDASYYSALEIAEGAVLTNHGIIQTNVGGHTDRFIDGDLVNHGTIDLDQRTVQNGAGSQWTNSGLVDIAAGVELHLNGGAASSFTQTNDGVLKIAIKNAAAFGQITGDEALALDGDLSIARRPTYKPANGVSFPIAAGASRTGQFEKLVKAVIQRAKYFKPVYSSTGASLVVETAALAASPSSGPPGTAVTLTGSGYPADDTIALRFKDANGIKTPLGTVTTDAAGAFSVVKNVPGGAQPGTGKFIGKSALTAVAASASFNVT